MLIVDDAPENIDVLGSALASYKRIVALNGEKALQRAMSDTPPDLILLDVMMPGMDGCEVCRRLKAEARTRDIPVIFVTAKGEVEDETLGFALGAVDYITKPISVPIVQARVRTHLMLKLAREKIQQEQALSERLLLNILPAPIASRLKQGEKTIADDYAEVTVLFADIVGFTTFSAQISPAKLITWLNMIFLSFDGLAEKYGLEKIKTIGDAYMVVGGLPTPRPDHVEAVADMALAMQQKIGELNAETGQRFQLRIGMATGPAIAGVISTQKFSYDVWGDAVTIASRMESQGCPGYIQVTTEVYECLRDRYQFELRGVIQVKNKGEMTTYFLTGKRPV
ncbi:MAG: response regulator [Acidobacteriales bacterium]|nr:MAG: response regulator [Terriglobales bacterium]